MAYNFDFIKEDWPLIHESAVEAEKSVYVAPRTSAFYSRLTLEFSLKWLFRNDQSLRLPPNRDLDKESLNSLLYVPAFKNQFDDRAFKDINLIRQIGNKAAHKEDAKIRVQNSLLALEHLFQFMKWMNRSYSANPVRRLDFDSNLLIRESPEQILEITLTELETLEREHKEKEMKLRETEEENQKLKAEIEANKNRNKQIEFEDDVFVDPDGFLEAETRKYFIDEMLKEAGWDLSKPNVKEYFLKGVSGQSEYGYADYVLWDDDGKPLAVIEAKRTAKSAHNGKKQAELYADALQKQTSQRPVIFYTNGYETWIWDDLRYPPREVQGFYTKDQLRLIIQRRTGLQSLEHAVINTNIVERPYQMEAIRATLDTFEEKMNREALLVMATGSGKTRTAVALVDVLIQAHWVKNVLFLADRRELVKQAKNAFVEHLPRVSTVNLLDKKESRKHWSARIVFSTYPTMVNHIEQKTANKRKFGVGHFDLVIIDEAHRSVYDKYKGIIEYLDALVVGLTATPRTDLDRNTYELFRLEDDVPTFAYELDEAVADNYLIPPTKITVPLKFMKDGITYSKLPEDQKERYELEFKDEITGELPDKIEAKALNEWLFNEDTVDKVLEFLMEFGIRVAGGERLGKTIIFAKNHDHAEFIMERFDRLFPEYKSKFAQIIDSKVDKHDQLLDDFKNAYKEPHIAISVDMLDTGIDVPEIVNIVFFKKVFSKVKFWQMIGRGTRTCKDLFGPGQHKKEFYLMDFCGNLDFFGLNPEGKDPKPIRSLSEQIFQHKVRIISLLQQTKYQSRKQMREWYQQLVEECYQLVLQVNLDHFMVKPKRRYVDPFRIQSNWNALSENAIRALIKHVAPLIKMDESEIALRYDLMALKLQMDKLGDDKKSSHLINKMRKTAAEIEKKGTIPIVQQNKKLLRDLQRKGMLEGSTVARLEKIRTTMRELVQFMDREKRELVYTDFTDEIGEFKIEEFSNRLKDDNQNLNSDYDLVEYKEKVVSLLQSLSQHPTVQKLRRNQLVTKGDLCDLGIDLFSEDESLKERYVEAYGEEPLGVLVRRTLGMDVVFIRKEFADLFSQFDASSQQIRFLEMILKYFETNGAMSPDKLLDSPFTDLNDEGIFGLFDEKLANRIISIVHSINERAKR
ncbi:type I restriction enzyme R subunit [Croceifilum oryzae]|uniref:Type I restriction enzyme R subunit n=1 Tax=Croceifilum oryzae TaxID=1553429 RepID=A0AAJ1TK86_9BACL|nr:DEAD/DEAH box helicase family protein [Croceifilum oryzae]MDQ0417604.1 type I restriction enzyme R subunit [Croceifilum oryzae]